MRLQALNDAQICIFDCHFRFVPWKGILQKKTRKLFKSDDSAKFWEKFRFATLRDIEMTVIFADHFERWQDLRRKEEVDGFLSFSSNRVREGDDGKDRKAFDVFNGFCCDCYYWNNVFVSVVTVLGKKNMNFKILPFERCQYSES